MLNEIIWSEHSDHPDFLPADRLKNLGNAELETILGPQRYSRLAGAISNSKKRADINRKYCFGDSIPPKALNQGPYLDALLDVILRRNAKGTAPGWVVILGTIEDAAVGWHATYGRVATRSLLRIDETVFDEADRLVASSEVTFWDYYGLLHFGGTELCSRKYNVSEPSVGDKILLIGWMNDRADDRVLHRYHFSVREGEILPEPYLNLRESGNRDVRKSSI